MAPKKKVVKSSRSADDKATAGGARSVKESPTTGKDRLKELEREAQLTWYMSGVQDDGIFLPRDAKRMAKHGVCVYCAERAPLGDGLGKFIDGLVDGLEVRGMGYDRLARGYGDNEISAEARQCFEMTCADCLSIGMPWHVGEELYDTCESGRDECDREYAGVPAKGKELPEYPPSHPLVLGGANGHNPPYRDCQGCKMRFCWRCIEGNGSNAYHGNDTLERCLVCKAATSRLCRACAAKGDAVLLRECTCLSEACLAVSVPRTAIELGPGRVPAAASTAAPAVTMDSLVAAFCTDLERRKPPMRSAAEEEQVCATIAQAWDAFPCHEKCFDTCGKCRKRGKIALTAGCMGFCRDCYVARELTR